MKNYSFLVLLLAVLFAAGGGQDAAVRLAGKWKLDRIESPNEDGTGKVILTKRNFVEQRDLVVDFLDDSLQVYGGNTPTNSMAGKFRNKGGQQLEFVEFSTISRVAETAWGEAYWRRIPHVNAYSIRGKSLVIHCGSDELIFLRP